MEYENHQDKHIKHDSQHSDDHDIHGLAGVEPLPGVRIRTVGDIGTVLVSIGRCGAEAGMAVGNISKDS